MASSVTSTISRLLNRYWGIIVLLIWGGALLGLGLLRTAPYGLDEGAARGLLLIWSIFDKIVNPIVTLGIPDFRALLFIPLGAYWPGSLLAAKIITVVLAFIAVTLFYRWSSRTADAEAALIASTLLLIAPQFINEIDSIDTGVYLLFALAVGNWLNTTYRTAQRAFSGWFFMQLLWVGITITLHPAGLAYPLVLGWAWYKDPLDPRQPRRRVHGGLGRQSAPQSRRSPSGGDWRCRSELAHRRLVRPVASGGSVGRSPLSAARFRRHAPAGRSAARPDGRRQRVGDARPRAAALSRHAAPHRAQSEMARRAAAAARTGAGDRYRARDRFHDGRQGPPSGHRPRHGESPGSVDPIPGAGDHRRQ